MTRNARAVEFARSLVGIVRDQQLTFLAAAIAYYAFVSVIPLVLVALAVASAVAGEAVARQVLDLVGRFLTPTAADLVEGALVSGTGRSSVTAVGLVALLWSSLRVFRGLDVAFSRVYGSAAPVSLFEQVRDALLVVGAVGLAFGATVLLGTVLPLSDVPFAAILGPIGLVVVLSVVFLPLYSVFPDSRVPVREAVPGAVFAGGGWALLSVGFSAYAAQAGTLQLYGFLGGVLLVLTWFYFGGLLVLLGAALNAVLGGHGDRQLQQEGLRHTTQMSDADGSPAGTDDASDDTTSVSTVESEPVDQSDLADLRRELERFEDEIEDRTVHRDDLEADLQQYVRKRVRRGHARGWGPYLVLLYGTVMTLGAFHFLSGGWAILAMVVVWLSTLGLYTLMVLVGVSLNVLDLPGRALNLVRKLR